MTKMHAELFVKILEVVRFTNQHGLAYGYLKKSIELGESIGGRLIEEVHKIGFYGLESDAYRLIRTRLCSAQ